jgi:hypothetical protein
VIGSQGYNVVPANQTNGFYRVLVESN